MQVKLERNRIFRHVGLACAVIALLIAAYLIFGYHNEELLTSTTQLKSELQRLQGKVASEEKRFNRFQEVYQTYEGLLKTKIEPARRQNDLATRVATARLILDNLKIKYGLHSVDIALSPIEVSRSDMRGMVIISNTGELRLSGITDSQLLSFAKDFADAIPGYIRWNTMKMSRSAGDQINDAVLEKLRSGSLNHLVAGNLAFQWRSLQEGREESESLPVPQEPKSAKGKP